MWAAWNAKFHLRCEFGFMRACCVSFNFVFLIGKRREKKNCRNKHFLILFSSNHLLISLNELSAECSDLNWIKCDIIASINSLVWFCFDFVIFNSPFHFLQFTFLLDSIQVIFLHVEQTKVAKNRIEIDPKRLRIKGVFIFFKDMLQSDNNFAAVESNCTQWKQIQVQRKRGCI